VCPKGSNIVGTPLLIILLTLQTSKTKPQNQKLCTFLGDISKQSNQKESSVDEWNCFLLSYCINLPLMSSHTLWVDFDWPKTLLGEMAAKMINDLIFSSQNDNTMSQVRNGNSAYKIVLMIFRWSWRTHCMSFVFAALT